MSKKTMILLANGYEEVEALAVVDVLRRANLAIDMVSITGKLETVGDHNIVIKADKLFEDIDEAEYTMVVLPGGLPGSQALTKHEGVQALLKRFASEHKYIAAICAAPLALHEAGIMQNRKGTGYPACCAPAYGDSFQENMVYQDDNIITGQGPAVSLYFAFKLAEVLSDEATVQAVKEGMLVPTVEAQLQK